MHVAPLGEDHALKLKVRLGQKCTFAKNNLDYYEMRNIYRTDLSDAKFSFLPRGLFYKTFHGHN